MFCTCTKCLVVGVVERRNKCTGFFLQVLFTCCLTTCVRFVLYAVLCVWLLVVIVNLSLLQVQCPSLSSCRAPPSSTAILPALHAPIHRQMWSVSRGDG